MNDRTTRGEQHNCFACNGVDTVIEENGYFVCIECQEVQ